MTCPNCTRMEAVLREEIDARKNDVGLLSWAVRGALEGLSMRLAALAPEPQAEPVQALVDAGFAFKALSPADVSKKAVEHAPDCKLLKFHPGYPRCTCGAEPTEKEGE